MVQIDMEKPSLQGYIDRLENFIKSDRFKALDMKYRDTCRECHTHMLAYMDCLNRIEQMQSENPITCPSYASSHQHCTDCFGAANGDCNECTR